MKTLKIALLALFTFVEMTGMAQKGGKGADRQAKADSILIVKLELTQAEQDAFLPLYHEYVAARKANRKKYAPAKKKGKKKMEDISNAEMEEIIQKKFAFTQADLDIKKQYHEKFKTALSIKKIAKFYHIEKRLFQRKPNNKGRR